MPSADSSVVKGGPFLACPEDFAVYCFFSVSGYLSWQWKQHQRQRKLATPFCVTMCHYLCQNATTSTMASCVCHWISVKSAALSCSTTQKTEKMMLATTCAYDIIQDR